MYTWKNPADTKRYQIDYILVRQRYRNSVKKACSYPGADADTDHNLVLMKTMLKMKKVMKKKHRKKWNLSRMKQQQEDYRQHVELQCLYIEGTTVTDKWEGLKKERVRSAKGNIGSLSLFDRMVITDQLWHSSQIIAIDSSSVPF